MIKVEDYACFKNIPNLLKKRDLKGMIVIYEHNEKSLIGNIVSVGNKNLSVNCREYKNNRHYKWEEINFNFIYIPTENICEENIDKFELYKRIRKGVFIDVSLLNKLHINLENMKIQEEKQEKNKSKVNK